MPNQPVVSNCLDLQALEGQEFTHCQIYIYKVNAKPHWEPPVAELRSTQAQELFLPTIEQVRAVFGYVAFGEESNEVLAGIEQRCYPHYEPGQFVNWIRSTFAKPPWMPVANHIRIWLRKGIWAHVYVRQVPINYAWHTYPPTAP